MLRLIILLTMTMSACGSEVRCVISGQENHPDGIDVENAGMCPCEPKTSECQMNVTVGFAQ
jgi:hypothetical protein